MIDNEPHESDPEMSLGEFQEKYKEMSFVEEPTPEVHVPPRETKEDHPVGAPTKLYEKYAAETNDLKNSLQERIETFHFSGT